MRALDWVRINQEGREAIQHAIALQAAADDCAADKSKTAAHRASYRYRARAWRAAAEALRWLSPKPTPKEPS